MVVNERSDRNRTMTLTEEEKEKYLSRCTNIKYDGDVSEIIDRVSCANIFDVLHMYPSSIVDLLIVDPPYNLSKIYGESSFKRMSDDEYYCFTSKWIEEVKHTLKPNATIYVCCDWKSGYIIEKVLRENFFIQNRITWQREKGRGANKNWKNSMEDIWFATMSPKDFTFNLENVKMRRKVIAPYKVNGKPKDWAETEDGNFRDTCPSNFWDDISVPYWSMPENTDHPTQKPEKLMAKLILASSNPGDVVFDPFLGSGTTAVVAKKLGRHFMGIESEEEYCALAQKRLELAGFNTEIQGYCDGVFWERNTLALQQKLKSEKRKYNA
jgi:site-specific DNA-methyltransferase (adenine-specific)